MNATQLKMKRRSYPSDITEAQWSCISPLLATPAGKTRRGRKCDTNLREVINAINYRWSTGCVWRMLPHDLPAWNTIYYHFHRWEKNGTLKKIRNILLNKKQSPYIDFLHTSTRKQETKSVSDRSTPQTSHHPRSFCV